MTWLLDGNVLVALMIDTHSEHAIVSRWFRVMRDRFATCSVTQGTLLRLHMRFAADQSAAAAWAALAGIEGHPLHDYWNHDLPYRDVPHAGLLGQRQVTDAWLVELAAQRGARLATLDRALANAHPQVAFCIA